jgi:hypothetical protein
VARLLPLLLALACEPVHPATAHQTAQDWANGLDLMRPVIHCHSCGPASCLCDVKVKGDGLYPLSCGSHSCEVRVR